MIHVNIFKPRATTCSPLSRLFTSRWNFWHPLRNRRRFSEKFRNRFILSSRHCFSIARFTLQRIGGGCEIARKSPGPPRAHLHSPSPPPPSVSVNTLQGNTAVVSFFPRPRAASNHEHHTFKASAREKLMSFHLPLRESREMKRDEKGRGGWRCAGELLLFPFDSRVLGESLRQDCNNRGPGTTFNSSNAGKVDWKFERGVHCFTDASGIFFYQF